MQIFICLLCMHTFLVVSPSTPLSTTQQTKSIYNFRDVEAKVSNRKKKKVYLHLSH